MNFISHFYLDRHRSDEPPFLLGIITPDLVGIFDRSIKLKQHTLPQISLEQVRLHDLLFYKGVRRHFEADAVFHSCRFFVRETEGLAQILRNAFPESALPRSYFLAHILVELLLDKILIQQDPEILPEFYGQLQQIDYQEQLRLTEWVCQCPMPRYQAYLVRFLERQYLYEYQEWQHILFVLRRILDKVNINIGNQLHHPHMLELLQEYELTLQGCWRDLYDEMDRKMGPI